MSANSEQKDQSEVARAVGYLPIIAGVWIFYVVGYAALSYGHLDTALGVFTTLIQITLDMFACIAAALFSRSYRGASKAAFLLLSLASLGLAVTNLFWGILFNILEKTGSAGYADLSFRIPFAVTTLCWLGFWWIVLARESARNLSVQGIAVIATAAVLAITVFLLTYIPLLDVETPGHVHVFVLVYASLELVALIICACAALLKILGFPTLLGMGFLLFVSTDFLFNSSELTGRLEPNELAEIPWVLAEACIAAGIFALHDQMRGALLGRGRSADETELYSHNMMPILLFAGAMAAAILAAHTMVEAQEVRVFITFLIVGFIVIAANRLALLHGEAVRSAVSHEALLAGPEAHVRRPAALHTLGSYRPVMTIRKSLLAVRTSAIRVSSGFAFTTAETWADPRPRTIFLAMPYGKAWSDDVHAVLRDAASAARWRLNRSDHRYRQQDLLLNIWSELCGNAIVFADITEYTPNVLYEIGIAHAIGKPVILFAQKGVVLPFDLSVKRTIFYEHGSPKWGEELAVKVRDLLEGFSEDSDPAES